MKLGAHMPTSGGVWRALQRGRDVGCEVVQVFVKNNMRWLGNSYLPEHLSQWTQERGASKFSCIFGHAGYLINLAAPTSPNRDQSLRSLIHEIELATALDLPFLVLHPGSHLGRGESAGIEQAAAGLKEVFRATPQSSVRIALENTAGQGSCLGHRISQIAEILDRVGEPRRMGICLDTAHFFAAGYDIRTVKGWNAAMKEVESLAGLESVLAFHLNDSKTALGSKVDRHAGIGQGLIGRRAFRHIINDIRFMGHPGCLETPKSDDLHEDIENLALLRSLLNRTNPRRKAGCV